MLNSLKKKLLAIPKSEASFLKRGFEPCDPVVRKNLEHIIHVFIDGYSLAQEIDRDHDALAERLHREFDAHHVGFAFEGAGMHYAVSDLFVPFKKGSQLRAFTAGSGEKHDYITSVGAGFAVARVPWAAAKAEGYMKTLDPRLVWCLPDGYGFHQGFFEHRSFIDGVRPAPADFPEYAKQLFDSGVGRSIWWVNGGDPERIKATIDKFPAVRRAEMWCGIGLACCYAGGVDASVVPLLNDLSGDNRGDFLSGVPFATRMRQKGLNPSPWSDQVCQTLLGIDANSASDLIANLLADAEKTWNWVWEDRHKWERGYQIVRKQLTAQFGNLNTE